MKTILGAALVATICILSTAQAATINRISYQNGGTSDPSCGQGVIDSQSGSGDLSVSYSQTGPGGCSMAINANVFGGGIGVFATTTTIPGGTFSARAQVGGQSLMTDIIITPLIGYTGPFLIPVQVHAQIGGSLRGEVREDAQFARAANASVNATVTLSGARGLGGSDSVFDSQRFDDSAGITSEGLATKTLIGSLFASIDHDIRRPMTVNFSLSGGAAVVGGTDSFASATLNAMNTLSFSKTGAAFILPNGLTVNAPELNIFNNRWVDPRVVTPPVSTVPLPAGLPLLLAGLGTFGWLRRKQSM